MNGQLSDQTRSKNARQSLGIRSTRSSVRSNRLAKAPISLRGGAFGAASIETYSGLRETKAKRARERGYVQLFLSHKAKDQLAATEIFQVLKKAGKRKLEIFMSENVQKGDNRQRDIDEQLHASDWFLFLYTGNYNDDWSWCHHEAGFFRGMMYPDPKRVVVFYPAESISVPNHPNLPDPLKAYQGVRCEKNNPGEIYRFFTDVFAEDPYPGFPAINPSFASDQNISRIRAAKRIIDSVGRLVVTTILPENNMTIEIPNYKRLSNRIEFPDEAKILRSSGALRLFDVGSDSDFAWPEFQNALDQALHTCLHKSFWPAILKACSESITSRRVKSTYAVFRSPVDGHNYTPMINRVEIRANNSAAFQITFVQAAVGTQAVVRDKSVARIFTALNLAHRFRWEIIDRYRDPQKLRAFVEQLAATRDSRKANNGSASGGGLRVIWEAISLLEIESVNRGVYDEHELPADFKKGVDKRVRTMFSLWKTQRRRLEQATGDGDIDTFAQVLADLEPINVEFISLAAQRLGELVQADARPDNDQSLRGLTPAV